MPTHALNYWVQKWEKCIKYLGIRLFMFRTWIVRQGYPVWVCKLTGSISYKGSIEYDILESMESLIYIKFKINGCMNVNKLLTSITPWVKFRKYFKMRQGQKIHFKVLTLRSMRNFFFSWVFTFGSIIK